MTFPLPTFALINGIALGGGCEIATACDIRIARKGATLGFIQGQLSITTGWGGATLLYEKLSYEQAISFLYSAKKYQQTMQNIWGLYKRLFLMKIIKN